jgi:hypothetical protein
MTGHSVLLPLEIPNTAALRKSVASIIRDIQRDHCETDQATADRLGVHKNTIAAARNEQSDIGALTIARIGALYGPEAVQPYHALYGATAHGIAASDAAPLVELTGALAALLHAGGPKARLDALPVLKDTSAKLDAYINSIERWRNAA